MSLKIFILEDDLNRIANFRRWFEGHDVTCIDSSESSDAFQGPYDLVCLDHDLGGRQLTEHEDNGYTFIQNIGSQLMPDNQTVWICHSFNPAGADSMAYALKKVYHQSNVMIEPFGGPRFFQVLDAVGISVSKADQKQRFQYYR